MTRIILASTLCLLLGCSDDDDGGPTEISTSTSTSTTTAGSTSEAPTTSAGTGSSSSGTGSSTGGSSGSSGPEDGSSSGGGSSSSSSTGEPADPITIDGRVWRMPGNAGANTPEICFVRDGVADPCVTGDDLGNYELTGVPSNTYGGVRFSGDDIVNFYWMLQTEETDIELTLLVDTPALIDVYYATTGVERDPDAVIVMSEIWDEPVAGYALEMSPSSGEGPYYYLTYQGELDLEATATRESTALALFLNVDREGGPYETSFTREDVTCTTKSFGAPQTPAWEIPNDADIVYAAFDCPE